MPEVLGGVATASHRQPHNGVLVAVVEFHRDEDDSEKDRDQKATADHPQEIVDCVVDNAVVNFNPRPVNYVNNNMQMYIDDLIY